MDDRTYKSLQKVLKTHAKGLGIPSGAAEVFIDKTLKSVSKSLAKKSTITEKDLQRAVAKELKKYHADLAYVYQNYDTII